MAKGSVLKRTQVQGKKYDLPSEDVNIEKLIQKGLSLSSKILGLNSQLEQVKRQLTTLAVGRREGNTTVNLKGVSGSATVTFRESYVCDDRVGEIKQELGSLFDRFFTKTDVWKTTKELKQFIDGEHALGLKDPVTMKALILAHVEKKETKPNVKIAPQD